MFSKLLKLTFSVLRSTVFECEGILGIADHIFHVSQVILYPNKALINAC
jgi:hypothetical protein